MCLGWHRYSYLQDGSAHARFAGSRRWVSLQHSMRRGSEVCVGIGTDSVVEVNEKLEELFCFKGV